MTLLGRNPLEEPSKGPCVPQGSNGQDGVGAQFRLGPVMAKWTNSGSSSSSSNYGQLV